MFMTVLQSTTVLLALLASTAVAQDKTPSPTSSPATIPDSSSIWEKYNQAFGSRLYQAFTSPSALDECHKVTQTNVFDVSNPAPQVGCSSYANGAALAAQVRALNLESSGIFRPYYVSEDHDLMCFAIMSASIPTEVRKLFDFLYPVPNALKVHQSAYDLIDASQTVSSTLPPYLMVSTLMNSTISDNNVELGNIAMLATASSDLQKYQTSVFDDFFWTSSVSQQFFDQNTKTGDVATSDEKRAQVWHFLAETLENQRAGAGVSLMSTDPCGLQNLKIDQQEDGIKVSLDAISSLSEPIRSSCMAYLIAYYSVQPSTWSVSLLTRPQLFNYQARSIQQASQVGSGLDSAPFTAAGLRGQNQVVSVADTGVDVNSCYFYDPQGRVAPNSLRSPVTDNKYRKVIQYSYLSGAGDGLDNVEGHGTHVCGTIAGSIANADITQGNAIYGGVAPNAKIAFMDLSTVEGSVAVPGVNLLYGPGYAAGARVHSNSWGSMYSVGSYYAGSSIDSYLYNHMDSTILFASGNFGGDGYSTCSMESQSKNVVAVGASETTFQSTNVNYVAFYSSRGPAFDGRIKPDIVAPGDALLSARSNGAGGQSCQTISKTGTSMATPAAAGSALLIRQYFMDNTGKFWSGNCKSTYAFCKSFVPSGVLVKAALIHSATKMSLFHGGGSADVPLGDAPDNSQGYGRVQLTGVLPLAGVNNFDLFVDDLRTIKEYSMITYFVDIASSSKALRATISWYDPPGVDGTTGSALIHDLNLLITSPTGQKYYGNNLNTFDKINNNEQIKVSSPVEGRWKVSVMARALPVGGSQKFSLIITSRGTVA